MHSHYDYDMMTRGACTFIVLLRVCIPLFPCHLIGAIGQPATKSCAVQHENFICTVFSGEFQCPMMADMLSQRPFHLSRMKESCHKLKYMTLLYEAVMFEDNES